MKRTRFTATLTRPTSNEVVRKVILSYDASSVRWHYERLGFEVLEVKKGDYRKASRPPARPTGARPHQQAIQEAIDFLNIKLPVEIKLTSRAGGRYGAHTPVPTGRNVSVRNGRVYNLDLATGWKHKITVKNWLSAEQMGQTIWHELAHAMQFERDALPVGLPQDCLRHWRTSYRDGTAYMDKPLEVEARSYEPHNSELPLAR